MSLHIDAQAGDIAETVLLPGDPLRAKFIAEKFLDTPVCYNKVRGMLGYTGTYNGERVSVQGTGMGVPSVSIYTHELLSEYNVKTVMRVGTCGSIQPDIKLRDIILAMTASTDSNINTLRFGGRTYAPAADYALLSRAQRLAQKMGFDVRVGSVFTTDSFYHDEPDYWHLWAKYGVLALEMESAALYTIAAKFKAAALSILTVSDCLPANEKATSDEREKTFGKMAQLALAVAC